MQKKNLSVHVGQVQMFCIKVSAHQPAPRSRAVIITVRGVTESHIFSIAMAKLHIITDYASILSQNKCDCCQINI